MKGESRPKVSIIVPIYNVEKYLFQCLERIVGQTLSNIEIILVNDGSTDDSQQIAERFVEMDDRITLVNQTNRGLSIARNKGISLAKGDYLTFVDSDDFPFLDYCESMYDHALRSGADGVVARFGNYSEEGKRHSISPIRESQQRAGYEVISWMYFGRLSMSACAKLWKSELVKKEKLIFPEGLFMQDRHFNLQAFYYSEKVAFLDKEIYQRNINPASTMNTVGLKHINDCYKVLNADLNFLLGINKLDKFGFGIYFATFKVLHFIYKQLGQRLFEDQNLLAIYTEKLSGLQFHKQLNKVQLFLLRFMKAGLSYDLRKQRNSPIAFKITLGVAVRYVNWFQ
ncbi:glycosyltransferase family 2 protein [Pleomorphovibrio marinus]|uniref:glycosyltransferase family 2 protein n=1 Tax=Pleomorphovibrio marinus TaxID=2164132 RepID=UPI000E0A7F35|nr:glycosyltransferase family 2 protein [Pleomorphovibrio marinus]